MIKELEDLQKTGRQTVKTEFHVFSNWDDFLIFSREIKQNDLFVIIASRKGHPSYQQAQDRLPYYLSNYFNGNSFLLLYPRQLDQGIKLGELESADGPLTENIMDSVGNVNKVGSFLKNIFGRKGNGG